MADDKPHLHVEFYLEAVENPKESAKAGRPIFEDKEFVKVMIAGDPKNTFISPAHVRGTNGITYAEKFPEHYRLFKMDQDQQAASGTPLSEVPWLTAAKREELKALKIYTVEGLASLDGSLLARIGMGARELKTQAQAWIDKASASVTQSELAKRDDEIAELRAQIAALANGAVSHETHVSDPDSPFKDYDDETLRVFIEDRSGKKPDGRFRRPKLIEMAEAIVAEEHAAAEQKAA